VSRAAPRHQAGRPTPFRPRTGGRRGRLAALALALLLGVGAAATVAGLGPLGRAVRELTLPLRHEDVIRQQAAEKHLDPALLAGVVYEESKFRNQTSHAGARGLMQVTPETARFIARRSGATRFNEADLSNPQINIAYGAYFLRYLVDRYRGNQTLAIAAYNAGQANVDKWVRRAGGPGRFDTVRDIPFPETRAYVAGVFARQRDYRAKYSRELGY
jgi:soluble lytic murein transglycosylase